MPSCSYSSSFIPSQPVPLLRSGPHVLPVTHHHHHLYTHAPSTTTLCSVPKTSTRRNVAACDNSVSNASSNRGAIPTQGPKRGKTDLIAVKRAVPLSEYFSTLPNAKCELRARGSSGDWMARCPFHADDTPSLSISDNRGVFYCFGCGAQGDLFEAEKLTYGLDSLRDTLTSLAARFPKVRALVGAGSGSSPIYTTTARVMVAPPEPARKARINWPELVRSKRSVGFVLNRAVAFYRATLDTDVGAEARRYLAARGIGANTIRAFQVGYGGPADAWTYLLDALSRAHRGIDAGRTITVEDCVAAGVASLSKSEQVYDTFRGRLILPVFDADARVVAVAGRILQPSARAPKYVNSRESVLFKKKQVLYGAHLARDALLAIIPTVEEKDPFKVLTEEEEVAEQVAAEEEGDWDMQEMNEWKKKSEAEIKEMRRFIRDETPIFEVFTGAQFTKACLVVVEGYLDVLALHHHSNGTFPVVATMGTAVSVEQVRAALALLPDHMDCAVVFNFDNDEAGLKAAERLCDSVLTQIPEAARVSIAFPPKGFKDADEYLNSDDGNADKYMKHLRSSSTLWQRWRGHRIIDEELKQVAEILNEPVGGGSLESMIEDAVKKYKSGTLNVHNQLPDDGTWLVVKASSPERGSTPGNFSYQLSDELELELDKMMVNYGAPKSIISKKPRTNKYVLRVRPVVVEKLAQLLASIERIMPGCNSSELIMEWSGRICGRFTDAFTGVFYMISDRIDQITQGEHLGQAHWGVPPWEVKKMKKWQRKKHIENENFEGIENDKRRLDAVRERLRRERIELEQAALERRGERSRRFTEHPRDAAEERVLWGLARVSNEDNRLELLEKLIAMMIELEKAEGRFWTASWRAKMFDLCARLEGDIPWEVVAAECSMTEWWCDESAALFDNDDENDPEWMEVILGDVKHPDMAAMAGAHAVVAMEKRVRGRKAAEELGPNILELELFERTNRLDEADEALARQLVLKRYIREATWDSEEDKKEAEEAAEEIAEEERREREFERIGKMLDNKEMLPFEYLHGSRRVIEEDQ